MKQKAPDFSSLSESYQKFRPSIPKLFFDFLFTTVYEQGRAWDCAAGTGQNSKALKAGFKNVAATDISSQMIKKAQRHSGINHCVAQSECACFKDQIFDLVLVAQAIHWFDLPMFYNEVKRVLKKDGIIAAVAYGFSSIEQSIDLILEKFRFQFLDPYWHPRAKMVFEGYQNLSFPFEEIEIEPIHLKIRWNMYELLGFMRTWSGVKKFIEDHNEDPVLKIVDVLEREWGNPESKKELTFPLYTRIGKVG
jgi:ubiquinone/menaquinone biosynthesis C-methylase UbiE